jgi:hypothetical protein
VLDESMSSFRPCTTKLGGLPNISFILRKPEPIGTKFKTSVCPKLNVMSHMELCEGKEGMLNKPFQVQIGGTAVYTVRLAQVTSQSYVDNRTELVMGDLWFGLVKSLVSTKKLLDPHAMVIHIK